MRNAISLIMFMVLLICMFEMTFNVSPSEAVSSFYLPEKESKIVRVVEHIITVVELEELKREVGVWEQHRDYNQIINGYGTGLRPPTGNEWNRIAEQAYIVERVEWSNPTTSSPSYVDHMNSSWFPPIGHQDGEGSCTTWTVGYYMKTFQEAKEHGWNLCAAAWEGGYKGHPTPAYQNKIFSPDFIYHQINGGIDNGSYFSDAMNLVCSIGACSWEKMPYDPDNSTSWPSEEAWGEAPLYRGNSSGIEYMDLETDSDIVSLKNWIASDHLAAIGVDAYQYENLTSDDMWTLDKYLNPTVNHANTVVGYNDDLEYVEEGVTRYGAFKVANSWGIGGWENVDDGCYWISYEAMKQRVGHCMFYRDRIGYDPKLVASFKMDHFKRGECDITLGIGNKSAPIQTKRFDDWILDGGNHPFCFNNMVLDITEFEDAVPAVINQSFFMEVYDEGVPPAHSGMYDWYSDGVSYSWFRLGQTLGIPETGATLKFWSHYEIEEDWDYGYVEVHDLDTDEWYTLPGLMTVSTLPERQDNPNCPHKFEPKAYYDAGRWNAFTGFSGDWYQEEMDLTPFTNHTIEVYFTYWTDPYVLELGWYIDDIEIPEIGFFDDVESGTNGWTYNGWYITSPPSTTGTILSFSIEYYYNYSSGTLQAKSTSHDVPVNTTDQDCVFAELILKNVWIVDDDGPADFHTIQEGINAANSGDTIFVKNGIYYEHPVVNKTLTLIGEDRDTAIIDGEGTDPGSIVVISADNVKISKFTIRSSRSGGNAIWIDSCINITVSSNIITTGIGDGIRIIRSSGNTISDNVIKNSTNTTGIGLDWASDNLVFNNTIASNLYGIGASYSCYNNVFFWNTIVKNNYGIRMSINGCKFYHNNIINNTVQVYICSPSPANTWDSGYPSGGNYWSDCNGTDLLSGTYQNITGSDGIGDTPYVIDENNTDRYPLMKPYPWGPHDIGITSVATSKTVVGQGFDLRINVTIFNYGDFTESFNVSVFYDDTIITLPDGKNHTTTTLTSGSSTALTIPWNTTGTPKGNYTIKAHITPLPGETDTADNTLTNGWIIIAMIGDTTGGTPDPLDFVPDGKVDMKDIATIARYFGLDVPPAPANCDITGSTTGLPDGKIDTRDVATAASHFGETDP